MRPKFSAIVSTDLRTTVRPNDLSGVLSVFVAHRELATPRFSCSTTRPVPPPPAGNAGCVVESMPSLVPYRLPMNIVPYLGHSDNDVVALLRASDVVELDERRLARDLPSAMRRRCA